MKRDIYALSLDSLVKLTTLAGDEVLVSLLHVEEITVVDVLIHKKTGQWRPVSQFRGQQFKLRDWNPATASCIEYSSGRSRMVKELFKEHKNLELKVQEYQAHD